MSYLYEPKKKIYGINWYCNKSCIIISHSYHGMASDLCPSPVLPCSYIPDDQHQAAQGCLALFSVGTKTHHKRNWIITGLVLQPKGQSSIWNIKWWRSSHYSNEHWTTSRNDVAGIKTDCKKLVQDSQLTDSHGTRAGCARQQHQPLRLEAGRHRLWQHRGEASQGSTWVLLNLLCMMPLLHPPLPKRNSLPLLLRCTLVTA